MRTFFPRTGVLGVLLVAGGLALAGRPAGAAQGDLDPTFGDYGRVRLDMQAGNPYRALVARQSDGRILVARSDSDASQIRVVRLLPDGQPDLTFGGTGIVQTGFGGGTSIASEMTVRADGRILIAGQASAGAWDEGQAYHAALVALDPTGTVDASFGEDGRVSLGELAQGYSSPTALVSTSSDILVGIEWNDDPGSGITVVRLSGDGAIDTGVGDLGAVTFVSSTDFDSDYVYLRGLAAQEDGRLILCGTVGRSTPALGVQGEVMTIRLLADGSRDSSFGDRGVAYAGPGYVEACALQPDGRLVLAADFVGGGLGRVVRFLPHGALDPGFARDGVFDTSFGLDPDQEYGNGFGSSLTFSALEVLPDGRIAVGGLDANFETSVLMLGSSGAPDQTFGPEGLRKIDMGYESQSFQSIDPSFSFRAEDLTAVGRNQEVVTVARLHLADSPGASVIGFRGAFWIQEADALVRHPTVYRSGSAEGAVSVTYRTVDRTAQSPDDYEAASGTLVWPDGDTSPRKITVTVVDDGVEEPSESFDVILESPLGAGLTTSVAQVYVYDPPPPAETSPPPASSGGGGASSPSLLALLVLLWTSRIRPAAETGRRTGALFRIFQPLSRRRTPSRSSLTGTA